MKSHNLAIGAVILLIIGIIMLNGQQTPQPQALTPTAWFSGLSQSGQMAVYFIGGAVALMTIVSFFFRKEHG